MREGQAPRLQALNLRSRFGVYFALADLSRNSCESQMSNPWPKAHIVAVSPSNQRLHAVGLRNWNAIHQDHVASDAQRWIFRGNSNSVVDRRFVRHERGGCDDSSTMRFGNGAVYAIGHTKIVGVDDKAAHGQSSLDGHRS